ncbi:unnamed protein product [Brachionus calyciflorus]|uniref:Reverse transcriptase n=1 Tax=Brachionus calyciflorus TaxID=104777 RepID=A0A813WQQ8_9BILA|nr:unnamed protein product [Brachionus calyciflorus]
MLDAKLIQPSESSWASPLMLVSKPDGSIRVTIDYRSLNERTQNDAHPLPFCEDFGKKEVVFLGHVISSGSDKSKCEALFQFKRPKRLLSFKVFWGSHNIIGSSLKTSKRSLLHCIG